MHYFVLEIERTCQDLNADGCVLLSGAWSQQEQWHPLLEEESLLAEKARPEPSEWAMLCSSLLMSMLSSQESLWLCGTIAWNPNTATSHGKSLKGLSRKDCQSWMVGLPTGMQSCSPHILYPPTETSWVTVCQQLHLSLRCSLSIWLQREPKRIWHAHPSGELPSILVITIPPKHLFYRT